MSLPVHLTSLGASIESHQVEAVDPVFQTKMLEMLKQTGRPEMVVGKNTDNPMKIKVPYMDLHHHTVWGATGVILSEFRDLIS